MIFKRKKIEIIVIFLSLMILCTKSFAKSNQINFEELKKRLINNGFDKKVIENIYKNSGVFFDVSSVSGYFRHNESKLNYNQFSSYKNVNKAYKYLNKHINKLENVEKNYGVSKEIITAIILVETKLGTYTGNRKVINTFSTMASLQEKSHRNALWKEITSKNKYPRNKFNEKADNKSIWAFKELKAFLQYTISENIDPLSIKGSYAGAIGICQFIPSSIISYAKDGNDDGKIDLFVHEDAIESIANYLKSFGWRPNINNDKASEVLFYYNRSMYYVNSLLKIQGLLKKMSK